MRFDRLVGRWLRADGGYVLEIRAVSSEGRVDASYLNPRPINVARAEATRGGDIVTLLVELRDVNYPGSTYRSGTTPDATPSRAPTTRPRSSRPTTSSSRGRPDEPRLASEGVSS